MKESFSLAEDIYDETVDGKEGGTAASTADALERRAASLENGDDPWQQENDAMRRREIGPRNEFPMVAQTLRKTASDLRTCLAGARIKEFSDNTLGQARLGQSGYTADVRKVKRRQPGTDGASLLDASMAADLRAHELEHTKQKGFFDAPSIVINRKRLEAWKVFELGAISVQKRTDFVSDEYQDIAATTTISAEERQLIRDGKFRELERRKGGGTTQLDAAAETQMR